MDILHIYGISRAGFVPQLISLRLPNPTVVYELLQKAQARALIYGDDFKVVLNDCPVPHYPSIQREGISLGATELPMLDYSSPDDTVFIFHTSGSTSGCPKLVPCSHRWIDSVIVKTRQVCSPLSPDRRDVTVWMCVFSLPRLFSMHFDYLALQGEHVSHCSVIR